MNDIYFQHIKQTKRNEIMSECRHLSHRPPQTESEIWNCIQANKQLNSNFPLANAITKFKPHQHHLLSWAFLNGIQTTKIQSENNGLAGVLFYASKT